MAPFITFMPNGWKRIMTNEKTSADGLWSKISRRKALGLAAAGVAGAGVSGVGVSDAARAQSEGQGVATIEWKMVTSWPKDLPGPGVSAQRICDQIELLSGGRMRVRLYAAGELVPALEVFDAVSSGTSQMGHSAAFFWQGKAPASVFFTAVPFGLMPLEHMTWIEQGGGQALWDELYAPFGVKPFMAGNTGMQMGGWFTRQIKSVEDLKGLKIRMPGLGGEVMRRLGATPVSLPPGELFGALQSGLIDATEFLGPWSDRSMGFQKLTKLYYAPGFHEPNGTGEALINEVAFNGLPEDLQGIVRTACRSENIRSLSESEWMNAENLALLRDDDGVDIQPFPHDVMLALKKTSEEVVASFADESAINRKIHKSYREAIARLSPWSDVSTRLFLDARGG